MRRTGKNSSIELPISLTLTDDGKFFFNRRCNPASGSVSNGTGDEVRLKNYSAKTLQRLVYAGYISSIELSRSDFLSKREEIMDLSKLISYGILYKKFGMLLGRELGDTSLISLWNRKNPRRALNENSILREGERNVSTDPEVAELMGNLGRRAVSELTSEDEKISVEERELLRLKAEHFLEWLNPLLWRILMSGDRSKSSAAVYREIEEVLKNFLSKTTIADYLSLLIVELVEYAEMTILKKAVSEDPYEKYDVNTLIRDKNLRKRLLERMEKSRRGATLAWRVQGRRFTLGSDKATHIVLSNRMLNSREVQREIEDINNSTPDGFGLAELYSKWEEEMAGRLGLSYLSYLEDACVELGVRFKSHVKYIYDMDMTLITLSIRL